MIATCHSPSINIHSALCVEADASPGADVRPITTAVAVLLKFLLNRLLPARLRTAHPNHFRIASGMLAVAVLVLGAKLVAAVKEMAVAWRYGTGSEVDVYLLAVMIVSWLPVMIAAVGTVVFVPRLIGLRNKPAERSRFVDELNGAFFLLGLVATLLPIAFGPSMVQLIANQLPVETQHQIETLILYLSPLALLTVLAGYLAFRLQAHGKQGYTFLEAMPAFGILTFVLFAPNAMGADPLVWGTLIGAALQLVWSARMVRNVDGTLGKFAIAHNSPHWQATYGAIGAMALGQIVMGFSTPIDQFYAAQVGEGAVATLGYANRIISLASSLGAVAIARALLPVLSEAAAKNQRWLGYAQTTRWSVLMLGTGVLIFLIGWLLAPWIVGLLFERGAFAAEDTRRVAQVLRVGFLQLPFFFSGIVLVQWIVALGNYRFLFFTAVFAIFSKVVLNELMIQSLGLNAVMYATAGMYATSWLLQVLFLRQAHARLD